MPIHDDALALERNISRVEWLKKEEALGTEKSYVSTEWERLLQCEAGAWDRYVSYVGSVCLGKVRSIHVTHNLCWQRRSSTKVMEIVTR